MITVTKKQASLALVVVAFTAIMIAGSIVSSTGNAFAWRHGGHFNHFNHFNHFVHFNHSFHHGKKSHVEQSIDQGCIQPSRAFDSTFGLGSRTINSGNNVPVCVNANLAGNVAATDQSNFD